MRSPWNVPQTRARGLAAGAAPAVVVAVVLAAFLLPRVGRLPWDDYWGFMPQIATPHGFTHDPLRWLSLRSNEHLIAVPGLVYAATIALFHGDNRVQGLLAIGLLLGLALVIMRIALRGRRRPVRPAALGAFVALMVYTPAGAVNLFMGFAGIHWYMADVLAALAVALVPWAGATDRSRRTLALVGIGLLAALCYSTSLALWPALVVTAALQCRGRPRVPLVVAGAAVAIGFFALTYHRPPQVPPPTLTDLADLAKFVAVFLGAPFAASRVVAGVVGLFGLAASLVVATIAWRRRQLRPALAPWAGLGTYAFVNACMAATARVGMGGAHSSRYAELAVLFWIACLLAVLTVGSRGRRLVARAATTAMAALVAATWLSGAPLVASLSRRAARQPLATLALQYDIDDREAVAALSPAPAEPARARAWASAVGQAPFDRAVPAYDAEVAPAPARCDLGSFAVTRSTPTGTAGVLRLEGTLSGTDADGARLLFADRQDRLRGIAVTMPHAARIGGSGVVPWGGYVVPAADGPLRIVTERAGGRRCTAREVLAASGAPAASDGPP